MTVWTYGVIKDTDSFCCGSNVNKSGFRDVSVTVFWTKKMEILQRS